MMTAIGLTLLTALLLGHPAAGLAEPIDRPPPGELVDVGSHRLHLHCIGGGDPTVVLDAGLGGTSMDWVLVQERIARHARVCAYDRAGYGWSDAGPGPRTSRRIADELHRLLHTAHVPGPYILVGHSFGGVNVRLFASRYQEDTAGLVLIDSSHERQSEGLRQGLPRNPGRGGQIVRMPEPEPPAAMPGHLAELADRLVSTPTARRAILDELTALRTSLRQVAAAATPRPLPTVVISRGRRAWPHTRRGDARETRWRELQRDLAERYRPAVHVIAAESGHHVPLEAPKAVLDGVRTALEYVRTARSGLAAAIWPELGRH